jgi:hypothetical protein
MSLSAEFDSPADRRAYAVVAVGAAALSYAHARTFFLPFMGTAGATASPLMLDAVLFWLASACVRQAKAGRPLPMLRIGAYAVLALSVLANALGGATWPERVFMALPAALFGFLTEARIRLALYHHRAEHGDERIRLRLWLRHPLPAFRAWLWLARQSAPAFDRATAERDRLSAARDAVRLALPGRSRPARRARAGVLRELNAGRLAPALAVTASGLLDMPEVPALHRAALAAALGDTADVLAGPDLRTELDAVREALRTEIDAVRVETARELTAAAGLVRTEIDAVRDHASTVIGEQVGWIGEALGTLRKDITAARAELRATPGAEPEASSPEVDRDALVAELADQIRDAIAGGERWAPDYDALMERTGYRRSWCEKAVRDARTQAFSGPHRTDPGPYEEAPFTGTPRLRRVRTDDTPDSQPPNEAA